MLRELLSGLLLARIGAVCGSLRARNLRSRRRRRAGGSIVRSLLRYYRARLEGLVVECGRGSLRVEAAFLEAGLEGRAAAVRSKCEGFAEELFGLYKADGLRWLEAGWENMASAWPGCH